MWEGETGNAEGRNGTSFQSNRYPYKEPLPTFFLFFFLSFLSSYNNLFLLLVLPSVFVLL